MLKRAVTHSELCDLIALDFSTRWLGDETRIRTSLKRITASRAGWVEKLALAIHQKFAKQSYGSRSELVRWLSQQEVIKRAFRKNKTIDIDEATAGEIIKPKYRWSVPRASTEGELADMLCLRSPSILDWLILPHVRRRTPVDHYRRRWLPKRDGRERLIEEPRPVLKRVQRLIADQILTHVPLHDSAHAYRSRRSTQTCASEHVDKHVVLKMDLQDFFGTISSRRVSALFRRAGYGHSIAIMLARLCTAPPPCCSNLSSPDSSRINYSKSRGSHLPQGAPSSPAIANAVAYQLDRRLAGIAASVGAAYTRYADDLYFSGNPSLGSRVDRFATSIAAITMEEGFKVNHRKSRTMFYGHRQSVLGLTVNEQVNIDRGEYETLKAILYNCQHQGWRSQNRNDHPRFAQHLRGRIANISQFNSRRAERLLKSYEQVNWD